MTNLKSGISLARPPQDFWSIYSESSSSLTITTPNSLYPKEPIFFPKLQIYFADFPYPLYHIRLEASNPEDLMRLSVRLDRKIILSPHFSRIIVSTPDGCNGFAGISKKKTEILFRTLDIKNISQDKLFPWSLVGINNKGWS